MLEILNLEYSCTGCSACVCICPKSALSLQYDDEGFYYPSLNAALCIDCRLCEKSCPVISPACTESIGEFSAYMGRAKSTDLISKSSSGGIFSVLAESVLAQGGVVYGAIYNFKAERLEHVSTDDYPLENMRKSKYMESFVGDAFREVKNNLRKGRKVLFCGTPCQIIGLKKYLGKDADNANLLSVDFICHGVQSNSHFTDYKHYVERRYKSSIVHVDFRPKNHGWRTSNILFRFANGKTVDIPWRQSLYYAAFQNNMGLRKSCYRCDRISKHESDITIGDFWGILTFRPEADDNQGISVIIVNSLCGNKALDEVRGSMETEQLPVAAVEYAYKRDRRRYLLSKRIIFSKKIKKYGYLEYMKRLFMLQIITLKMRRVIGKIVKCLLRKNG